MKSVSAGCSSTTTAKRHESASIHLDIQTSAERFGAIDALAACRRSAFSLMLHLPKNGWGIFYRGALFPNSAHKHLNYLVATFVDYYHTQRPHQSKGNEPLLKLAESPPPNTDGEVLCEERLGGLLKHYYRQAA